MSAKRAGAGASSKTTRLDHKKNKERTAGGKLQTAAQETQQLFSRVFHSSPTAMVLSRLADGVFVEANQSFLDLTGYTLDEVIGRTSTDAGILSDPVTREQRLASLKQEGRLAPFDVDVTRKTGETRSGLASVAQISIAGEDFALSTFIDITERRKAEQRLARLRRLYATLSQINQTIVRFRSRTELFETICDVSVQYGQFTLAWIGLLDAGTGDVRPVAANGLDLADWPFETINLGRGSLKDSLVATAIRTSRVVCSGNLQTDKSVPKLRGGLEASAYRSSAAVPFRMKGTTVGALHLVSSIDGLFTVEEELQLLDEMSMDISFALDTLEAEAEHRRAEAALAASEERYRGLFEHMSEGYAYCRMLYEDGRPQDWIYLVVNAAFATLTGLKDAMGKRISELLPGIRESDPSLFEIYSRVALTGQPERFEMFIEAFQQWYSISVYSPQRECFVAVFEVITERKRAQEKLEASERALQLFVEFAPAAIAMVDRDMKYIATSRRYLADYRLGDQHLVGRSHYAVFPEISDRWKEIHRRCLAGASERAEDDEFPRADGTVDWVHWEIHPWYQPTGEVGGLILFSEVTTARRKAAEAIRESERQMTALLTSLDDLVFEVDEQGTYLNIWAADEHLLFKPKAQLLGRKMDEDLGPQDGPRFTEAAKRVLAGGRREDLEYSRDVSDGQRWFLARISPILAPDGRYRTASMLIRDITEQKHAAEQIRRQVEHLNSLREIDTVISSSFDMKFSLEAIVTRAVKDLEVDAADIMVLDPGTGTLEYHAGYGFHSVYPQQATLRSSEGLAGRSLMERKSVYMRDLREHPELLARHFLLSEERFAGYYCVPLINKREIKGVLEIFQRTPLIPHQDWIDFLQTLAGQAAIAIESASLFDGLQRSNLELGLAYDETLEGWSRALDLRDKETEGHTRRVTEVTVRLARAFGFGPQEIQHIRRGALLHDIGKLGVPDEILLKPGPLTDEEWVEMRKHPQFGYDLIAPIRYLQPALDIPYCHHEKWDGSGYPRGLKGDEIPLAARLFAVVDVWDALRHDRPYRTGWPQEKVLAYIRTLDGTHFDPQAVQLFFEVMSENTRGPGE